MWSEIDAVNINMPADAVDKLKPGVHKEFLYTNLAILSNADLVLPVVNSAEMNLPKFSPEELIGVTFLKEAEDGQVYRAEIVKKINDLDAQNHHNIKMIVKYSDDDIEEIMAYTELCDIIEDQMEREENNPEKLWIFKEVLSHSGPLKQSDSRAQNGKVLL